MQPFTDKSFNVDGKSSNKESFNYPEHLEKKQPNIQDDRIIPYQIHEMQPFTDKSFNVDFQQAKSHVGRVLTYPCCSFWKFWKNLNQIQVCGKSMN